ncbi:protein of unknown function [Burkholderia multivorans]
MLLATLPALTKLKKLRILDDAERELIEHMLKGTSQAAQFRDSLSGCLVEDMNDGGMGSLRFYRQNSGKRFLREDVCQMMFSDADGVPVLITLSLDNFGQLFELDVWKVDFSPLKRFPVVR